MVVYSIFYAHRKKVTQALTFQIDTLLYVFDKAIYHHKDAIFDYSTAKPLLFHNQYNFFTKGGQYTEILPNLLQDISYVSDLLGTSLIEPNELQSIQATYTAREKIYTLKEYTHTIITILTL
jgi:hypothetical protein